MAQSTGKQAGRLPHEWVKKSLRGSEQMGRTEFGDRVQSGTQTGPLT